jgi:hypothetical protein
MDIQTTVRLGADETFGLTLTEAAGEVLKALGGDEKTDHSTVTVAQAAVGEAGTPPNPMGTPSSSA